MAWHPRHPPPRRCAPLLFAAALLLSSPAHADRAWVVLDQTISGQSNLFRSSSDEQADGSYQVRPRLRFQRPKGEIEYDLEYSPSYDVFFETDGIDGFDQFGRAELSYSPVPVSTFFTRSEYAYYRSIRSNTVEGPGGNPEIVGDVSGRVFRALADLGYRHSFSSTTNGEAFFAIQSYDYSTQDNTDNIGFGGEVNLLHEIGPNIALGAMVAASHRRFEEVEFQPASDNRIVRGGPILRMEPIPTFIVEAQFGPAWVVTDRDAGESASVAQFRTVGSGDSQQAAVFLGCGSADGRTLLSECPFEPAPNVGGLSGQVDVDYEPGSRPPSRDEDELTGFGQLELRKNESWGFGSVAYLRGEDASSGNGATTVRDSVTATVSFGGDTRWNLRLRGNWNQRETVEELDRTDIVASESAINSGIPPFFPQFAQAAGLVVTEQSTRTVDQFWFDVRLKRPITRFISFQVDGRYLYQDRSGGGGEGGSEDTDFDNWRGGVTLSVELPRVEYGW